MTKASAIQIAYRNLMAGLALVSLCQCALPPGSAWSVIRKDGFKDYLAISWGKKPVPEYVKELLPEAFGRSPEVEGADGVEQLTQGADSQVVAGTEGDEFPSLPSELPQDWTRPVEPVFPLMSTDPPEFPSLTPPVAASYGSPNPPLLSTGSGPDEFAQVFIPEFLNQSSLPVSESTQVVVPKPAPGLKMKDPTYKSAAVEVKRVASTAEDKVEAVKKATEAPKGEPKVSILAGGETEAGTEKFLPSLTVSQAEEVMPFGIVVSGRPGYVRSPFAKPHQVVDVSGLKVGDVVKCPFSGQFFRVPAVQEALNRAPTQGEKGDGVVETKAVPETATSKESSDKP